MHIGKIEFTPEQERFRRTNREVRQNTVIETGWSEGRALAYGLRPSLKGFFQTLVEEGVVLDTRADLPLDLDAVEQVWQSLNNPAKECLVELVFNDVLIQGEEDQELYLSRLGQVATAHLSDDRW